MRWGAQNQLGPRIVAAGRPIAMTGGHGYRMAIEADGVDAVMAAVRSQIKAGTDVIKLMVTGGVLTPGQAGLARLPDAAGRDCCRGAGRSPGWSRVLAMPRVPTA